MLGQIVNKIEYQVISYCEAIQDHSLTESLSKFSKEGWQVINCQSYKDIDGMTMIRFILQRVTQSATGMIDTPLRG